jgi:hypothetical protein
MGIDLDLIVDCVGEVVGVNTIITWMREFM